MARKASMVSYCLRHQERVATTRCSACMTPLCNECALETDIGVFCGTDCHEKRVASNERLVVLEAEHRAGAGVRMLRTLLSWLWPLLILCAFFFLWPKLPPEWRAPFENVFKHAKKK